MMASFPLTSVVIVDNTHTHFCFSWPLVSSVSEGLAGDFDLPNKISDRVLEDMLRSTNEIKTRDLSSPLGSGAVTESNSLHNIAGAFKA